VYELTTLENGLRVITVPMPYLQSASVGFFLRVGSRCESAPLAGASHFVEHMLFKGTARRPKARDIAEGIEGQGGIFNASTGVETTLYWAKVAAPHLAQAMDVLSDMLLHAAFDHEELEKERAVIVEELKYDYDSPDSLVQLLADELQWPGHALGRSIAGSVESVGGLERATLLRYMGEHYLPGQTVVGLSGKVNHAEAVALAQECLSEWGARPTSACEAAPPNTHGPRLRVHFKDTEQTHLNLSFAGLSRGDPDRYVLRMLNTILGEGMRSRLFQEVRERLGLAYGVDTSINLMEDTGSFGIYAGVATESAERALRAILGELDRVRQEAVPAVELQKAKEFARGRIALGLEDPFSLLSWYARQELLGPDVLRPEEVVAGLESVQAADLQRLAQVLFQEQWLNLAVVGPLAEDGRFGRAVHF